MSSTIRPWLKVGSKVKAGDKLTEGHIDPKELIEIAGVQAVQNYILKEVEKVYSVQGIDISDKHIEVIIKQMLKKVVVLESGDSGLSVGQTLSVRRITAINDGLLREFKTPAKFGPILLGISKSSVETDSFLSAASFQETTKVLTDAAVNGKVDHLLGLKENVIIGKLIPAGTGSKFERESTIKIEERALELKEIREAAKKQHEESESLPEEVVGNNEDFDAEDTVNEE